MATTSPEFPQFSRLPLELRIAIWELCRPHRVMELDTPHQSTLDFKTYCDLDATSFINQRWPILTRVCRESREVAFRGRAVLGVDIAVLDPRDPHPLSSVDYFPDPWFCPTTDIVHLSWNDGYSMQSSDFINPIPYLHRVASKGIAASITAEFLHPFDPPTEYDPRPQDLKRLIPRMEYLVTLRMVPIHLTKAQAARSGLFGRLAEERIKLVDPFDEETMRKYYELWKTCPREDQDPAGFFNRVLDTEGFHAAIQKWSKEVELRWLRYKFYISRMSGIAEVNRAGDIWVAADGDEAHVYISNNAATAGHFFQPKATNKKGSPWVRKQLEEMPRFIPRIMFRLCQQKCYTLQWPRKKGLLSGRGGMRAGLSRFV